MDLKNILFKLAAANETEAVVIAEQVLAPFGVQKKSTGGNTLFTINEGAEGKHVLLDAHMDEIAMVVTSIEKNGFVKVTKCGGMDRRILPCQEVTVWGKEPVFGVVCSTPPHLDKDEKLPEWGELTIDLGLSAFQMRELVSAGDRVTLRMAPCTLMGDRVTGKALDDRAGVAALLRAAELLREKGWKAPVTLLLSTQEEVGTRGAVTGSYGVDADEAIAVDVSFARTPDSPAHKCGELGKGPMLGISPILDAGITARLRRAAKEQSIPIQDEVMGGETGTNADVISISRAGIKTGLVSIPLRYMHTGVEVISLSDVENTAQMIAACIEKGGEGNA
ncbi:MAG: M42 family metallopeptidase [Clostridiales bacterium]|nr:M42 family metallopeptidase [Clostridiales bacterium]